MDVKLPFVLGLAGRKGVGKTYLAKQLEERGWVRMSYADGVRDLALSLDPILAEDGPERWRLSDFVKEDGWDASKERLPEVRRILQVVGTEIGRAIDPDVWVNKLASRVYKNPPGTRIVVDDVRFQNEADKIRFGFGGVVVLLRGGETGDSHASEAGIDNLNVSFEVNEDAVRSPGLVDLLDGYGK